MQFQELQKTQCPIPPEKDYDFHEKWNSGYACAESAIKNRQYAHLKTLDSDTYTLSFRLGVRAAMNDFCKCFGA